MVLTLSASAEAAPKAAGPSEALPADFLEFLGSWETQDGRWVDPFPDRRPLEPGPNRAAELQQRKADLEKDDRAKSGKPDSQAPAATQPAPGSHHQRP